MGNTDMNRSMVIRMDLCMLMYACILDSDGICMDSDVYGYGPLVSSFEYVYEGLVFVKNIEYFDQQDHSTFRKHSLIRALVL